MKIIINQIPKRECVCVCVCVCVCAREGEWEREEFVDGFLRVSNILCDASILFGVESIEETLTFLSEDMEWIRSDESRRHARQASGNWLIFKR